MIEPRCWIEGHGRPSLLRDDFAVGENGFTGPPPGPDAPAEIDRHLTACSGRTHQRASQSFRVRGWQLASSADRWRSAEISRREDRKTVLLRLQKETSVKAVTPPTAKIVEGGKVKHVGLARLSHMNI
jgi:hypothetical protein